METGRGAAWAVGLCPTGETGGEGTGVVVVERGWAVEGAADARVEETGEGGLPVLEESEETFPAGWFRREVRPERKRIESVRERGTERERWIEGDTKDRVGEKVRKEEKRNVL